MKRRSGLFIAGHFFGFTSEGVRVCIYTGFFLIVFSSPQNHLVYQFSRRLRVSVINDQLTLILHTPSFGVIAACLKHAQNIYVSPDPLVSNAVRSCLAALIWHSLPPRCTWGQTDDRNFSYEKRSGLNLCSGACQVVDDTSYSSIGRRRKQNLT
jgi:hypothetical protein